MAFRRRGRRRWSRDDYPESSSPLPADGIKARTRAGQSFGQTWWGGKWIAALERLVNPGRLRRGRSYARRGQVLNIDFEGNRIESSVQGTRSDPYEVSIEISSIDDKRWDSVIDAMASQAIFAAKLLAGEMPQDIEDAFSSARVALFPERRADLQTECSCPDYANPCKHISAVYYLLGERFDADPFLLFGLRGRSKDQIIAELRARRAAAPEGSHPHDRPRGPRAKGGEQQSGSAKPAQQALSSELGSPLSEELEALSAYPDSAHLEDALNRFWELDPEIEAIEFNITPPAVEAAPIKRLGQPPFWHSKANFISEMESVYRNISRAAINTAMAE
jgi:uncharacterized Zn finger protein